MFNVTGKLDILVVINRSWEYSLCSNMRYLTGLHLCPSDNYSLMVRVRHKCQNQKCSRSGPLQNTGVENVCVCV